MCERDREREREREIEKRSSERHIKGVEKQKKERIIKRSVRNLYEADR